jgi:hypothetical protein
MCQFNFERVRFQFDVPAEAPTIEEDAPDVEDGVIKIPDQIFQAHSERSRCDNEIHVSQSVGEA